MVAGQKLPSLGRFAAQLLTALLSAAIAVASCVDYSAAQQQRPAEPRSSQPAQQPDRPADRQGQAGEREREGDRNAPSRRDRAAEPTPPAPGADRSQADKNERLGRDTFAALGGDSPFCKRTGLREQERRNCRGSGALSHPTRIDHYGFDIHIDTGVDNIAGNFSAGVQLFVSIVWMAWLYVIKGVMLLLEWAFSLDLLDSAMSSVKKALTRLNTHVFGQAWFLAAISAAGLWAIYSAFVLRRTIATFTGLAATVALMVIALVLIHNPVGTVGKVNSYANDMSLYVVSGASGAGTSSPARGFGQAMSRTFDQAVVRPWCALEFSDIDFCLANPRKVIKRSDLPGDQDIQDAYNESSSVAAMFLRFEPNGEDDVDQRNKIYEEWKNKDGSRLQAVVRIQKEAATGPRIALWALISISFLGMVLLLAWIGLRLLGYGVLSLVLILFAPVALLLPALGESGRATAIGWLKRLAGALIAKVVYSIFLALVLVSAGALAELNSIGYFAVWLLQAVFWWILFFKRDELLEFTQIKALASPDQQGSLAQRLFYARQNARGAGAAAAATGAAVAAPAAALMGKLSARDASKAQGIRGAAYDQARQRARGALGHEQADAQQVLDRDRAQAAEQTKLDRLLHRYDERALTANANGGGQVEPTEGEAALLRRRDQLAAQRTPAAQLAAAQERVRHADVNKARFGDAITPQDEAAHLARRRDQLARLPVDHDHNLRAAGIDPDHYRQAPASDRESLRHQATKTLAREGAQLDAIPDVSPSSPTPSGAAAPPRSTLRAASKTLDGQDVREARKSAHDQRRAERRAQRTRARLHHHKRR